MRSIYDNVVFKSALVSSVAINSLTGSTALTSAAIDTLGYNTAVLRVVAELTSSNPSVATVTATMTESATSGGSYTAVNDNTGTAIGFTLDVHAARAEGLARVEGLGTSRKRYQKIVVTPAFTGGTSPAILCFSELVLGRGYSKPANSAVSNT